MKLANSLACGSEHQTRDFAQVEDDALGDFSLFDLTLGIQKHAQHLLGKNQSMRLGIELEQRSIDRDQGSTLLLREAQTGKPSQFLHACHFLLEQPPSSCRQAISLPPPRGVLLLVALNPIVFEHPAQRSVQRSGTEPDPALAHLLDILQDGVAMTRLRRQAKKNEQNRFGDVGVDGWHLAPRGDMSCDDISVYAG